MKICTKISVWLHLVTRHYAIETPDHVGAFAGAYLERKDWDHA